MQAIDTLQWVRWIDGVFTAQYPSNRTLSADEFHHRGLTLKGLLFDLQRAQ
jgi:hypothetical protein